jgi:hypothetical protein
MKSSVFVVALLAAALEAPTLAQTSFCSDEVEAVAACLFDGGVGADCGTELEAVRDCLGDDAAGFSDASFCDAQLNSLNSCRETFGCLSCGVSELSCSAHGCGNELSCPGSCDNCIDFLDTLNFCMLLDSVCDCNGSDGSDDSDGSGAYTHCANLKAAAATAAAGAGALLLL